MSIIAASKWSSNLIILETEAKAVNVRPNMAIRFKTVTRFLETDIVMLRLPSSPQLEPMDKRAIVSILNGQLEGWCSYHCDRR
jgi:hypothetical protein